MDRYMHQVHSIVKTVADRLFFPGETDKALAEPAHYIHIEGALRLSSDAGSEELDINFDLSNTCLAIEKDLRRLKVEAMNTHRHDECEVVLTTAQPFIYADVSGDETPPLTIEGAFALAKTTSTIAQSIYYLNEPYGSLDLDSIILAFQPDADNCVSRFAFQTLVNQLVNTGSVPVLASPKIVVREPNDNLAMIELQRTLLTISLKQQIVRHPDDDINSEVVKPRQVAHLINLLAPAQRLNGLLKSVYLDGITARNLKHFDLRKNARQLNTILYEAAKNAASHDMDETDESFVAFNETVEKFIKKLGDYGTDFS